MSSSKKDTLRTTADKKWISIYDVIKMIDDELDPEQVWNDIKKNHPEILEHTRDAIVEDQETLKSKEK